MNFSIHANFLFLELCITLHKQILYNSIIIQQLRQEFRTALGNAVMVTHAEDESEPSTSVSTESYDTSPPRVLWTHHQHMVDYVRLMMEEGEEFTLGND